MRPLLILLVALLLATLSFSPCAPPSLNYTILDMDPDPANPPSDYTVFAAHFTGKLDPESFPPADAWEKAAALHFAHDWQGENSDPERSTEVRLLWTREFLFLRFHCRYRTLTIFADARSDGWRYELWDRDVVETFLQPDARDPRIYREFEVSPNGYWIDLAVWHGQIEELFSGMHRRVTLDQAAHTWTAEMALPMKCLTTHFDPNRSWRGNFFRIEGEKEPRFYAAWSPTRTPKPNFHVPSAFGTLKFRD